MPRYVPKIGDKFNRLTIKTLFCKLEGGQNKTYAICICECGNESECRVTGLVQNKTKSCGCWKAEEASKRTIIRNFKHGKSDLKNNRLYRIWSAMKTRCCNPNTAEWKNYGGRGIELCQHWKNDFECFESWAINNGYSDELTIDRIDVNKNYEPSNCRWVGRDVQARNRRNNRQDTVKITAFGETQAIGNWLEDSRCKVKSVATICYRIGSGWTPEDAISKPSERK